MDFGLDKTRIKAHMLRSDVVVRIAQHVHELRPTVLA